MTRFVILPDPTEYLPRVRVSLFWGRAPEVVTFLEQDSYGRVFDVDCVQIGLWFGVAVYRRVGLA